jgi:hypothetical protein
MDLKRCGGGSVRDEEAVVFILSLVVLAGVILMIAAMMNRRRIREMEHRERLAMIERGLIPSPESDPGKFESATTSVPPAREVGVRYRTAGVLMIGLGFGLMLLISFTAGEPSVGIGIGGGWAVLGVASLLNYFLISSRRDDERGRPSTWHPPAPPRPDPPSNIAP